MENVINLEELEKKESDIRKWNKSQQYEILVLSYLLGVKAC